MPDMYKDVVNGVSETVEIDGYPFYGENIRGNTSYNHRKLNRQKLLGGTEHVARGEYMVREYQFETEVYTEGNPTVFDEIFHEMVNKECEVISPYMGGKFKAEVTIERNHEEASPEHMGLDVTVIEIPEEQPNIPGESFIIPEDVLQKENSTATDTVNESNVTETENKTNLSSKSKSEIVSELKNNLKARKE